MGREPTEARSKAAVIYSSALALLTMNSQGPPSNGIWIVLVGGVLCAALVWIGLTWPHLAGSHTAGGPELLRDLTHAGGEPAVPFATPFLELLKLVAAASIGVVVT